MQKQTSPRSTTSCQCHSDTTKSVSQWFQRAGLQIVYPIQYANILLWSIFFKCISWIKMSEVCLRFDWSLFLRFELMIYQQYSGIWTYDCLAYWRMYASFGLNELIALNPCDSFSYIIQARLIRSKKKNVCCHFALSHFLHFPSCNKSNPHHSPLSTSWTTPPLVKILWHIFLKGW